MKSLSSKIIGKRSALSLEGFLCDYFMSGSPVIISDCMGHWPARTRWNDMDYLKRVAGDRTVPVEVINLCVIAISFQQNQMSQWECPVFLRFLETDLYNTSSQSDLWFFFYVTITDMLYRCDMNTRGYIWKYLPFYCSLGHSLCLTFFRT